MQMIDGVFDRIVFRDQIDQPEHEWDERTLVSGDERGQIAGTDTCWL
jgi:hypothetical protein